MEYAKLLQYQTRETKVSFKNLGLMYHVSGIFLDIKTPFDFIAQAGIHHLFTSAIPLLLNAGTFACCVSALCLYVPHYRTRYIANSFTMTMLTLSLARTPDQHRQLHASGPELKPFVSLASKQQDYRCTPLHPAKLIWKNYSCLVLKRYINKIKII